MRHRLEVAFAVFLFFMVIGPEGRASTIAWQTSSECLPHRPAPATPLPASQEGAIAIYVLKPYNLHLSLAGASTGQLRVYDEDGVEITSGLSFFGYDSSLISVSPTGLVTALRTETTTEIGTWISAAVDGRGVQNSTVARVLSKDYGIDFVERVGVDSVIFSPLEIDGENIDQYVDKYEMLTVVDYAFEIQLELIHTTPFEGARQIYEVDFGESETSRVCGISGNPVRLGWNLNGNEWTNCFLVPFFPPRSPQWFVITHELGHNTSWPSGSFGRSIGPEWVYSEGVASYLSLVVMRRIVERTADYPVGKSALDSLEMDHDDMVFAFMNTYVDWMTNGAPFGDLDPNIVDAILLNQEGAEPEAFADRYFNIFKPENQALLQPILDQVNNSARRHTVFAAACSAAAQQDLYDLFLNTYHYPLDTAFFNEALAAMNNMPFSLFVDGFESGDTSAWSRTVP
jgi:hypothetical protein